jgi:hypothetical protein
MDDKFPKIIKPEEIDTFSYYGVTIFIPDNPNAVPREWPSTGRYDFSNQLPQTDES